MNPAEPASASVPQAELWKPVLLRAVAALVFGAVTIFWAAPSVAGMGLAGGLYLLATGAALFRGIPLAGLRRDVSPGRAMSAAASVLIGAGVTVMILQGSLLFAVIAALGIGLLAAVELYFGWRFRGRHILARDWIASGVIGLGTAVALPFFIPLGPHALLGVAGGGAIISGVLWILAGLSLRHDARSGTVKAVN